MTRASAALKYIFAIAKAKLDWLCSFKKHHKATKQQTNQSTEVFMRNAVLDGVRKILETYYMEKS